MKEHPAAYFAEALVYIAFIMTLGVLIHSCMNQQKFSGEKHETSFIKP